MVRLKSGESISRFRFHGAVRLPTCCGVLSQNGYFMHGSLPPAIRCTNLVKRYDGRPPVEAVRGLDLEIAQGECFGLLGPNGAGKTTTIEILEGLLAATSGQVEVLGLSWNKSDNEIRQRIGISLQETRLSEKLTVLETVTLFRSFYRQGYHPADVLARVSLEEKAHSLVGKLSGGQKQRLAVATAIVGDPELLFLDEPTTGLDPQSRRQLWEIIRELRSAGRTVLLTTHYMDEAERLCDRVAIVDRGQVIALGTPHELILSLGGEHMIEFSLENGAAHQLPLREELTALPGVIDIGHENGLVSLSVSEPHIVLPALLDYLKQRERPLKSLTTRHASLEDVFVKLAGRHLEDAEAAES